MIGINICYLGGEPIKYFHRTLSVERDRTWEIVQPVNSRDAIGPFGAEITDFAYCYNLGFKRPQRETSLDEGEVAGCFNWRPYTNGNTTSFEPEMYSLLPSPENLTPIQSKQHEYTLMDMVQQHQQNNPHAASLSTPSDWFLMGSKELVSNFSRSMSALGHFGDYWQECTKEMARSFALALLSGPTHLIDLEGIVEDGFNEENTRSLSSEHCIAAVTAMFRFAKLEPPMDHRPSLRVPVRYFICSNLVSTPYDIDHSHAVLIISLHRVIALTRHHRAVEQASLNPELFLKRLHTFTKNSIGKTG